MSTCLNGHEMSAQDSFCALCGGPISKIDDGSSAGLASNSVNGTQMQDNYETSAQKKTNKLPIIIIAILVIVGAAVLIAKAKPATHDVTFTLKVYDDVGCDLGWGYANVLGMDVDLEIDGESFDSESLPVYGYPGSLDECVLSTTFYGVPEGHDNYSFDSIRGTMEYSESEMSSNDWEVNVTLGLD